MTSAPNAVLNLVERFDSQLEAYRSGRYKETALRREFIDPLFTQLGWDVANKAGHAEAYKDVIHEDAIKVGGATKAPDYCFRVGGRRIFFVEAKKPSVDIAREVHPAYQLRRYAWSAKLPLSILTDFEEFAVYDCRIRPKSTDKAAVARTMYLKFTEYTAKWDQIESIFAKESVQKGSFDKYVASSKKRGTAEVDTEFLKEIEKWRVALARNIALRNPRLKVRELNFAVQRTIDRVIFLRMAEDRGIERYASLHALISGQKVYARLMEMFHAADDRYNSGLFHFRQNDPGHTGPPDGLTPGLKIDDKVLSDIFRGLYYPASPYEFSVLGADILGNVYEQFLGKVIRLTAGHHARVEEKPEVKKAGGVYYTPKYIVEYIVKHTVGRLLLKEDVAQPPSAEQEQTTLQPGAAALLLKEDVAQPPSAEQKQTTLQPGAAALQKNDVAQPPSAEQEQTTLQPGAAALQKNDVAQPPSAEPRGPFAKPSPLAYRRNLPHIQNAEKPLFITFCTADRWELPESVRQAVLEHCLHDHGRKYWLHGVVVMPDHVHMVLSPLRDELACAFGLPEIMNGIKGASAHTVNRVLKRRGHVWQAESFDHILRSQENVRQKVEYICENPVRKGLVENSDDYRWLWREWIEGVGDVAQPPSAEHEQTNVAQPPSAEHEQTNVAQPPSAEQEQTTPLQKQPGAAALQDIPSIADNFAAYKTPQEIGGLTEKYRPSKARAPLRVLDPACGSGSFLVGAYKFLLDYHRDWFVNDSREHPEHRQQNTKYVYQGAGGQWYLTTAEKKRILLSNIYGVDIDSQAVEVTKLNLLLCMLKNENQGTIDSQLKMWHERALPDLGDNIKCGNSLIGPDFYQGEQMSLFDEEARHRINAFDWPAEFPEILGRKAGKNPGFDAVIGNPPYVDVKGLQDLEVRYIFSKYPLASNRINLFATFIERGLDLIRSSRSFLGMIVPTALLAQSSYKPLRGLILKECDIADIVRLPNESFGSSAGEVKVDTVILVLSNKGVTCGLTNIIGYAGYDRITSIDPSSASVAGSIPQDRWRSSRDLVWTINTTDQDEKILAKCESNTVPLEQCAEFCLGLTPYDKYKGHTPKQIREKAFHATCKKNETFKPLLAGKDVRRYSITWNGEKWLSYGPWLGAPREQRFFTQERILVKQIIDWTDKRIWASIAREELYNTQNAFNLLTKDRWSVEFILGLLNSRLLSYYHRKRFLDEFKMRFQKVLIKDCRRFPVPRIDFSDASDMGAHDRMVELVESMLKLHKDLPAAKTAHGKTLLQRQIDATDKQIDQLVYELYGLTDEEIRIVEGATS